eukprot:768658-Hanusia_phi.AAC.7
MRGEGSGEGEGFTCSFQTFSARFGLSIASSVLSEVRDRMLILCTRGMLEGTSWKEQGQRRWGRRSECEVLVQFDEELGYGEIPQGLVIDGDVIAIWVEGRLLGTEVRQLEGRGRNERQREGSEATQTEGVEGKENKLKGFTGGGQGGEGEGREEEWEEKG